MTLAESMFYEYPRCGKVLKVSAPFIEHIKQTSLNCERCFGVAMNAKKEEELF